MKVEPKTPIQTPKPAPVPRPDGRGALMVGGNYGNKGGGARPSKIVAILADSSEAAAKQLWNLLQDESKTLDLSDLTKVIDATTKHVIAKKSVTFTVEAKNLLQDISIGTAEFFRDQGQPEMYDEWLESMKGIVMDV